MNQIWKQLSFALTAGVVGALVATFVLSLPPQLNQSQLTAQEADRGRRVAQPLSNQDLAAQDLGAASDLSSAFRNVADALRPSVVSITTRAALRTPKLPPGFEQFFRLDVPADQRVKTGEGSGVIVRSDGYILTNNHVVAEADELVVETSDGRTHAGTIVGTDPKTDLAVLKIEAPDLQAVAFGDSDDVRVGDWVLAIGSPFGLSQTVTAGIISGKNRDQDIIDGGDGFEDFLQTDAAINPGNSGGPLVNLRGELIGINTAILSRSGASAGIGFAIPESLARPVLNSIIQTGKVHRGFLGASFADVRPELVEDYGLQTDRGALIQSVLEGQPAALAGLQPGDVVTEIDGRPLRNSGQMRNYVANRPPGTTVVMKVNRNGQVLQIPVTLKEMTAELMAKFSAIFGIELVPVTPETLQRYGLQDLRYGLIVVNIQDDSPLADTLQVGDVIERVGQIALNKVEDFHALAKAAAESGKVLPVVVRRGNTRILVRIE